MHRHAALLLCIRIATLPQAHKPASWVLPPLHSAVDEDSSDAAFFCDDLHQALEQLLSGGGLAPEAAASLAAAQVGAVLLTLPVSSTCRCI